MGAYYREIAFYENLAGRLGDSVPGYHLAAYDPGEGWFTLVLDDGTHTHAVGVPKMPGFGVGYVQRGDELDEIGAVSLDQQVAGDGLVTADTITSGPEPELELAVRPLAYGPILPEAPDGRVTHFVRAMCDVTAADGRKGTGWVEWNRNQG
jgi:hypothetical protein